MSSKIGLQSWARKILEILFSSLIFSVVGWARLQKNFYTDSSNPSLQIAWVKLKGNLSSIGNLKHPWSKIPTWRRGQGGEKTLRNEIALKVHSNHPDLVHPQIDLKVPGKLAERQKGTKLGCTQITPTVGKWCTQNALIPTAEELGRFEECRGFQGWLHEKRVKWRKRRRFVKNVSLFQLFAIKYIILTPHQKGECQKIVPISATLLFKSMLLNTVLCLSTVFTQACVSVLWISAVLISPLG